MTADKIADLVTTIKEAITLWTGKPRRTGDGVKRLRAAIAILDKEAALLAVDTQCNYKLDCNCGGKLHLQ